MTDIRQSRVAAGSGLALAGILGLLAAIGLSSCGGDGEAIGTRTITRSVPAVTAPGTDPSL